MTFRSLFSVGALCSLLLMWGGEVRAQEEETEEAMPAPYSPFWRDLGQRWYEEAYAARKRGDLDAAREALYKAIEHGADKQLIALELGYLGKERHDLVSARQHFEDARKGTVRSASNEAGASLAQLAMLDDAASKGFEGSAITYWLNESWRAQQGGLWDLARHALERAQEEGAAPQLITLELAYLEARTGDLPLARAHFEVAATSGESEWARVARRELQASDPSGISATAGWEVLLQQGWRAKDRGDLDGAQELFEAAADRGADPQGMALELAYLALKKRDRAVARRYFEAARRGDDPLLANQARRELAAMSHRGVQVDPRSQPWYWMEQGWDARDRGELDGARQAFLTAADLGGNPQQIALELGYLHLMRDESELGRQHFEEASQGADEDIAQAAQAQLDAMAMEVNPETEPGTPGYWMTKAWAAKDAGALAESREAFFYARELGASGQRVALELGYLAILDQDTELALLYFEEASLGVDPAQAAVAAAELEAARPPEPGESVFAKEQPEYWLEQGWKLSGEGDHVGARRAFLTAGELGGDPQLIALELGYNALARGDRREAWEYFHEASEGPDPDKDAKALAQLEHLTGPFWGDIYGDTYGWWRLTPERSLNAVPMIRARGYWTPWGKLDLHAYLFIQASRDLASRGRGPDGYPLIYADNTLMFGPGVLFRFLDRRAGVYAQLGPAVKLVDDGEQRWWFDARIAAYLSLEGGPTWPGALPRGEWSKGADGVWRELYAEAVYASRFDHNIIAMARGRAGLSPLVSGSVAWQPLLQVRAFGDLHGDYWNNRADLGIAHRWRWQTKVPLDVLVGFNVGSYYGRENLDEAPDPLVFTELWLQAVTYYQF